MNAQTHVVEHGAQACGQPEARYRLFLNVDTHARTERRIRNLITAKRGDLRALEQRNPRRPERLEMHLGDRRLHDVIAALEAAGFMITGVVATRTSR